ncbi:MAG: ABC transporter ATP-binding protein [Actinomycetota bacterium]|nr:ABC transporter ATP-binding protein [Actinomycetota bacterium]
MSTQPAIEIDGVGRDFAVSKGGAVRALDDVSFSVGAGEVVALLGANGAGKTTLTKILATLLLPTRGTARVMGHDVVDAVKAVRGCTGVILGGDKGLYDRISAGENMRFFGMLAGVSSAALRTRIPQMLEQVNLADVADRRVETYSKGMRQRLQVAIGLLARPAVLLLDEPTVGLDPVEAGRLRVVIAELRGQGVSVLLTSHLLLDVELLADRVVMLESGRIRAQLPVAAFAALAGYAAVVSVTFRGELAPGAQLPDGAEYELTELPEGLHRADIRLREWSGGTFGELGGLLGAADVVDISVRQPSLDEAFVQLANSGKTQ